MGYHFIQADATRIPLASKSVDFVMGSPPYLDARLYLEDGRDMGISRKCDAWSQWMMEVTRESLRVSNGLVIWICAGKTEDYRYQPGPEMLLVDCYRAGIRCWRPCYWHRVGISGSGGPEWFRADIEYALCFTECEPGESPLKEVAAIEEVTRNKAGNIQTKFRMKLECGHFITKKAPAQSAKCPKCVRCLPWSNNTANGHPPKYGPGGGMSYRLTNGERVNQWGRVGSKAGFGAKDKNGVRESESRPSHRVSAFGMATDRPVGTRNTGNKPDSDSYRAPPARQLMTIQRPGMHNQDQAYQEPVIANPGNLLRVIVGGGVMGHPLCHLNEAPYPTKIPLWFIRSHCKPGGTILDPFSGSGTTADAAIQLGRNAIGCDLRMSQCELGRRRMLNPVMPKVPAKKRKAIEAARALPSLF